MTRGASDCREIVSRVFPKRIPDDALCALDFLGCRDILDRPCDLIVSNLPEFAGSRHEASCFKVRQAATGFLRRAQVRACKHGNIDRPTGHSEEAKVSLFRVRQQ